MYPNNNISQTISDLSFIDYGSSSGKWRANRIVKIDPVSFYENGLILSGKGYFKKSFGNNNNNFDDYLVEFYASGNNYEIDFINVDQQTNLSIERTGNSSGGFLLNYRGSPTSFSETGATGFYSFNFTDTTSNPPYLFGKANGFIQYKSNTFNLNTNPNGYFGGRCWWSQYSNAVNKDPLPIAINSIGTPAFYLDSFTIDFLSYPYGDPRCGLVFLATRSSAGLPLADIATSPMAARYPSKLDLKPLFFYKTGTSIRLSNNNLDILSMEVTSGAWNHISITLNKVGVNNYLSGYTDGILQSTYTQVGNLSYGYSLPISGLNITELRYSAFVAAGLLIDEIRVWSGAKSYSEINNLKYISLQSDPFLYNDSDLLYHVTVGAIYTKDKSVSFYKNGNLLKTNSIKNIYTEYLDYSNIKVTGQCEFDEFRFWSGVRTSGQISQQAKSGIGMDLFPRFQGGAYGRMNPTMTINTNTLFTQSGYFTSGFILDSNVNYYVDEPKVDIYSNGVYLKNLTFDFLIKTKHNGLNYGINKFMVFRPGLAAGGDLLQLTWNAGNPSVLKMDYDLDGPLLGPYRYIEFGNTNNIWNHYYFTMNIVGSNWLVSGYRNGENFSMGSTFSSIPSSEAFGSNLLFAGLYFQLDTSGPAVPFSNGIATGQELILDEFRFWSGIKTSGQMNELRFNRLGSKTEWMNDPNLLIYTPFSKSEFYPEDVNTGNLFNYRSSGLYSYPSI